MIGSITFFYMFYITNIENHLGNKFVYLPQPTNPKRPNLIQNLPE